MSGLPTWVQELRLKAKAATQGEWMVFPDPDPKETPMPEPSESAKESVRC